jgi:hypothetical protein
MRGYTYQINRKGIIAVEVEPRIGGDWSGHRLDSQGRPAGKVWVRKEEFFEHPEDAREALIAYHKANAAKHLENHNKSLVALGKVAAQKIK